MLLLAVAAAVVVSSAADEPPSLPGGNATAALGTANATGDDPTPSTNTAVQGALVLHLMPDKVGSMGAMCLDGSPAGFYFENATSDAHADDWVIILQGGGWCLTELDCVYRSYTGMGSSNMWSQYTVLGGYASSNCTQNPAFCEFNRVYVGYCDGTSYAGYQEGSVLQGGESASDAFGSQAELWFRGAAIIPAVLETLRERHGLGSAQQVLFSGCSAGGMAAYLHSNRVHAWFQEHAPQMHKFQTMATSGMFLDSTSVHGEAVLRTHLMHLDSFANMSASLDPRCLRDHGQDCLFPLVSYNYIDNPVFVMNSAMDRYVATCLLFGILPAGFPNTTAVNIAFECELMEDHEDHIHACTDGDCDALWAEPSVPRYMAEFTEALEKTSKFHQADSGAHIHTCVLHCQGLDDGWNDIFVSGNTSAESVGLWWAGHTNQRHIARRVGQCTADADPVDTHILLIVLCSAAGTALVAITALLVRRYWCHRTKHPLPYDQCASPHASQCHTPVSSMGTPRFIRSKQVFPVVGNTVGNTQATTELV